MPARRPAPSAMSRYLFRWASASDWSGDSNTARRVRHRLVEEQAVEVVAQVVVRRDVLAGPRPRVAPGAVREPARDLERQPPPARGKRRAPSGSGPRARSAPPGPATTTARPRRPRRHRSRRGAGGGRPPPRRGRGPRPAAGRPGRRRRAAVRRAGRRTGSRPGSGTRGQADAERERAERPIAEPRARVGQDPLAHAATRRDRASGRRRAERVRRAGLASRGRRDRLAVALEPQAPAPQPPRVDSG